MRWRIILVTSIIISWLIYEFTPVKSRLVMFLASGFCFSIISKSMAVLWNNILQRRWQSRSIEAQADLVRLRTSQEHN